MDRSPLKRSFGDFAAGYADDKESATSPLQCQPCRKVSKRQNAISWDDYFMAVSFLSAMRSKDPSTQVGACIVNKDKRIVGIGYNGFPKGCSDDDLPWNREGENELDTKYPYVCHAEVNAILNKISADVNGCVVRRFTHDLLPFPCLVH